MMAMASMLMPARVVARLTLAQTCVVDASARGMDCIRLRAAREVPLWTSALKPPMKSMPQASAARSMATASGTRSSSGQAAATSEMGVTAMRLLTIGMPNSASTPRAVATSGPAWRTSFS
jgi:hypothetical protein